MQFIRTNELSNVGWIRPENWHITLIFLGNFPGDRVVSLSNMLSDFFNKINPFHLYLDRFIYKPSIRDPKMIWAKFVSSKEFDELIFAIDKQLKEYYNSQALAYNVQIRKFNIPHITLARLKNEYRAFPRLKFDEKIISELKVKDCHLFESKLLPNGAEYQLLHTFGFNPIKN